MSYPGQRETETERQTYTQTDISQNIILYNINNTNRTDRINTYTGYLSPLSRVINPAAIQR